MDKQVNKNENDSRSTMWLLALLMTALVAGCGGGGDSGGGAAGGGGAGHAISPGAACAGADCVPLGTAGTFAILTKSGISTVPNSVITGDIGVSPIDQTAITGFSETRDASNEFSTSTQVVGKIYASDYAPPTPTNMTTAVSDMETAYTDAAGRTVPAAVTELGGGDISGLILVPGRYKWGTGVAINTSVTLSGGPDDVWLFQISQGLTQAASTSVTLTGGARPQNVFWQVFGVVAIGTNAHFEGIVMAQTSIDVAANATVIGRLMAQTAVTLNQNVVTQP